VGLTAPEPLTATHDASTFACGNTALDFWLRDTALKAEGLSARTYVVADDLHIEGYYSLATGSVERGSTPGRVRRNMPDPVPVLILARLAVATRHQGRGIGSGLLRDAFKRSLQASAIVGCRAILLHAVDDHAVGFYGRQGFIENPSGSQTMYLPLETLRRSL
jgi:GNAT superfamily N-acetyltransferase